MINKEDLALIEEGQKYLDAIRNNEHDIIYSNIFFYVSLADILKRLSSKYTLDIDVQGITNMRNYLMHPKVKKDLTSLKEIRDYF